MVKPVEKAGGPSRGSKGKMTRTTDDFELLKIILEENPRLKQRVLHFLGEALGKLPPSESTQKPTRE